MPWSSRPQGGSTSPWPNGFNEYGTRGVAYAKDTELKTIRMKTNLQMN